MNTQHIREHLKVAQMLAEKDGQMFLAQIIEVAIKAAESQAEKRDTIALKAAS